MKDNEVFLGRAKSNAKGDGAGNEVHKICHQRGVESASRGSSSGPVFRVFRLVRSVSSGSSPWNNFYYNESEMWPGRCYPPIKVVGKILGGRRSLHACSDKSKWCFEAGAVTAALVVLRACYRAKRKKNITVVLHVHAPSLVVIGVLVRILIGKYFASYVVTQHNDWANYSFVQRAWLRVARAVFDKYVLCSEWLAKSNPSPLRISRNSDISKVVCIKNGVDFNRIDRFVSEELGSASEASIVDAKDESVGVVVARMVPQKNCDMVLSVLTYLSDVRHVIWFGDGPELLSLQKTIRGGALESVVEFRGNRPRKEVISAFARSGFYLSCSRWEGLSGADLEALYMCCWPLMSNIPQRCEIARSAGITLCGLQDFGDWVDSYNRFRSMEKTKRDACLFRARRVARDEYGFERTIVAYHDCYRAEAYARRCGS